MTPRNDTEENAAAPTITVTQEGIIQDVSAAFEKAFDWQADRLIGELLTLIIPEKFRDAHHLGFSRFLTTGRPTILDQHLDLEILGGDGRIRLARHYITATKDAGQWIFKAVIHDADKND